MRSAPVLFLGALLAACDGGITGIEIARPPLESVELAVVQVPAGPAEGVRAEPPPPSPDSALSVTAFVADPMFIPRTHVRLEALVTTSSGDREDILLWPSRCKTNDGSTVSCRSFTLRMQSGHTVDEIVPALAQIDGRLSHIIGSDRRWATIWLRTGVLEDAMARASKWPSVDLVEFTGGGGGLPLPGVPVLTASTAVPLAAGPVAADDGALQASGGDTVTLEYVQPNGTTLTRSMTVP